MRDGTGELQLFVSQGELGKDEFARFGDEIDRGDWVGVEGKVMKTKLGELSVNVSSFQLLSKALRPLPEKWHGLSDTDTRYRQRYVDLIANDDARRVFDIRFAAIAAMRRFLADRGYIEVETPVLHPISGGATAKPFTTHHNALDVDLSLRIAPELYLKRLIVGGYDRVFEFARVFRNEGLSTRHNPEFTMLELYEAFADYYDMMRLTEELIADAAPQATGGTTVEWDGAEIDLSPPFERRTMIDLDQGARGRRRASVAAGRGAARGLRHARRPVGEVVAARASSCSRSTRRRPRRRSTSPRSCATTRVRCRRSRARTATTRRSPSASS